MDAWELEALLRTRAELDRPYLEFQRSADLSAGLYVLEAGGTDRQRPHSEDEVYVVLSGQATITVGLEERPVGPGSIVFVAAGVDHRFHDIFDDLRVLVAFGPAEGSRG
jgi:mannose-6-phosphate isomerase-like protein (cupin superfamily)